MPSCIEMKLRLSGKTEVYRCELLHYEPGFGILRYLIDREYDINGFRLAPGDETVAFYWENRPYTLYLWRTRTGGNAYYFNIADQVALSPRKFVWRDLTVDVLVDERGAQLLDEDELPVDLAPDLARYIRRATAHVLDMHREIIPAASSLIPPFA